MKLFKAAKHTQQFNGPLSGIVWVSRYQKSKTNLDFTEGRDSERHWRQLGYMQVCTSLQTDNHARTPPLTFLQVRCPSCCPTNSIKALKATSAAKSRTQRHRERTDYKINNSIDGCTKKNKLSPYPRTVFCTVATLLHVYSS